MARYGGTVHGPVFVAAFAAIVLATAAVGEAGNARGRPLRTGQSTCWDASGSQIACDGTGHDGDLRRGLSRVYVDNGDGTITDRKTALTWEKFSADGSIHDRNNQYSWSDAFAVKIATLNSGAGFAGHTDWRVPTLFELQTIVNLEEWGPAVSAAFHTACSTGCTVLTCSCTQGVEHWTSSSYVDFPDSAWALGFFDGAADPLGKSSTQCRVRAVRGGA